jgi:SAM-dependent methyltransferase
MQYLPIKSKVDRFFSGPVCMRKILYFFLDLLLLRAWHIRKALRKISGKYPGKASVLDAGAGLGQYSWRMSRMNKQWRIKAVDIDLGQVNSNISFFSKAGLSGRVICEYGDLTELNETEAYDFILSVDVMEHIKEDELVFRNFIRSLKPGGILLISTPSDQGGSDVHDKDDKSFIDEHVRNGYGIREITRKLGSAGFNNISASFTYGKAGTIAWHISMKYPVRMLNVSGLFFILLPFYYLIVFPFAAILNIFDIILTHKSGTGLLVYASK